jgi:type IV pilus assembly protein PilC
MTKKRTDGIGARLGSLFGKKQPERHVAPHIYVSTQSDVKKRKAKAKERAAKEKVARQTVVSVPIAEKKTVAPPIEEEPVAAVVPDEAPDVPEEETVPAVPAAPRTRGVVRGLGKIMKAKAPVADVAPTEDVAALEQEEGFMQKVKLQKKDVAPRKGLGFWTLMRERFSREAPERTKASTEELEPLYPEEEEAAPAPEKTTARAAPERLGVARDSFLSRISPAPSEPRIRVESTELQAPSTPSAPSALDEAVADSGPKKDPAVQREIEKAIAENADIKEEPAAPKPEAKAEKPAKQKLHVAQFQSKKGFKAFLTSINYIGMGKERISFIQNMATMLNAGLPLTDALKTLTLETRNKPMRKLLARVIDAVENGSPLWRAMEAQNFFSLHALALVRIGEEAGSLAENMGYLAEQDEKDNALRSKVKMAMIYPTIVMVIMFIIVVGLGMFVLPNLVGVLFSLNVKLPLITRIVIWCSDAFVAYGAVGVPSFIATFITIGILSKYTRLKVVTQFVMFKIPGIGRLAREATIARFGVILGGLLKAGVPVIEALESLVQVTPIASYKKLYAQILAHVTIGDSFQKSFASIKGSEKLLPPSVQQLVITGEKSGSLADIMLKVADIYDKKATGTAEKLPIILEPMLLLFIGGLVGSIAFAIIVPIYSIVGNVGAT